MADASEVEGSAHGLGGALDDHRGAGGAVLDLDDAALAAGRDALDLAPEVQRVVQALDPGLELGRVTTLDRAVGSALAGPRFSALLMTALGGVALLLTAVGIGGLMVAWVAARRHALGIRLALGADRCRLGRLVGRQAGDAGPRPRRRPGARRRRRTRPARRAVAEVPNQTSAFPGVSFPPGALWIEFR